MIHDRRIRGRACALALSLAAVMLAGVTVESFAGPLGRYEGRLKGKVSRVETSGRFDWSGTTKVRRKTLQIDFSDPQIIDEIKVKIKLEDRVTNDARQTLKVKSGQVKIRDGITGRREGNHGDFNQAKFRLSESNGTWRFNTKKQLVVTDIKGGNYDGARLKLRANGVKD